MRSRPEGSCIQCEDSYKQWRKWKYSLWPPSHWDGANIIACLYAPPLVHQRGGGKYISFFAVKSFFFAVSAMTKKLSRCVFFCCSKLEYKKIVTVCNFFWP